MLIELPGVNDAGDHSTQGPSVLFTFAHRGQAFVRMRVSWQADKSIVHPLPNGPGQPRARAIDPGAYEFVLQVSAMELPAMQKTIDSDLLINGVVVAHATGSIPDGQSVDHKVALFRLVVTQEGVA